MSADSSAAGQTSTAVIILPATREKFPELIDLILGSESMKDEERQYWVDILPVMTAEQIEQLRTILTSERQQLAAIDAKYAKDIAASGESEAELHSTEERLERAKERSAAEEEDRRKEEEAAEDVLKNL